MSYPKASTSGAESVPSTPRFPEIEEAVLAYAMDQAYTSARRTLLAEYRDSVKVKSLIELGVLNLDAARQAAGGPTGPSKF